MPSEGEIIPGFGDVVLVRFPFTNQTAAKQRPAVIVSSRAYNLARPDVVIMAITSQLRDSPDFAELKIERWAAAHLLKPSAVKPVFATVEQTMISKHLGSFEDADVERLRHAIATILQ